MKIILTFWLALIGLHVSAIPLKVAFVYVSPAGDAGWSYSHAVSYTHLTLPTIYSV